MTYMYTKERMEDDGTYELFLCKKNLNLLRVKIQSLHSKNTGHTLWIQFSNDSNGPEAKTGWYCTSRSTCSWLLFTLCLHVVVQRLPKVPRSWHTYRSEKTKHLRCTRFTRWHKWWKSKTKISWWMLTMPIH